MDALYDIVLHEKPLDEGLTKSETIDMIDALSEAEFLPIEIDSTSGQSVAVGFITMGLAEKLNYDYGASGLESYIGNILANMDEEVEECTYRFEEASIWLSREG